MNTIQATEFRVGNLFRFISTDSIEQVADIRTAGIKTPTINNVLITDIEPIPLNEDWLVRFGFEKDINTSWFRIGYFAEMEDVSNRMIIGYNTVSNRLGCYQEGDANGIFAQKTFQYVHQLQNLYFALTGTELTLTDK